jgi:hypothetical protein
MLPAKEEPIQKNPWDKEKANIDKYSKTVYDEVLHKVKNYLKKIQTTKPNTQNNQNPEKPEPVPPLTIYSRAKK